jgi:cell division protein FtsN
VAVKGKKKSQSRGSQGRRGPAQAPRAAYAPRVKEPWYQTTMGRILAALLVLLILAVTIAIVRSQSDTGDLTQRRNALDQYTGDVRALLQAITPAATEENGVPNKLSPTEAKALKTRSASWLSQLADAQQTAGKVTAPTPVTQTATILFVESIQAYTQAATIFGLAPSTSSSVQNKMLASGASLRNQATALWQEGINIVDQARTGAKMAPSGLRIPTSGAVAPPAPTPSASSGNGNKKNDKGDGGGDSSK